MLIPNLLFRENGAAVLLTNDYSSSLPPKYRLHQVVRIYKTDSAANQAVFQKEDAEGFVGVTLDKNLVDHVIKGFFKNFYYVGLKNLPLFEKAKYIADYVKRKLSSSYSQSHKPYVPNFSSVFSHYCIHCGGRAIIDGVQKSLSLSEEECEPSRAALFRYGNTSSASLWYEMNYIEGRGLQKKGDRTFQIAFGSGLKCNTVMWKALHTMPPSEPLPESFTY